MSLHYVQSVELVRAINQTIILIVMTLKNVTLLSMPVLSLNWQNIAVDFFFIGMHVLKPLPIQSCSSTETLCYPANLLQGTTYVPIF